MYVYIYIMYVMLLYTTDTIWLFNIAMDRSTMFKFGKASISMGHRNNHGELLVITKGYNKQLHILISCYVMLCYIYIYIMHVMLSYTTYITNNYTFLSCWSPGTTRRSSPSWQTPLRRFPWDFHMGFPYGISMGFLGDTLGHCEWLLNGYPLVNIPKTMENHHF